MRSLAQVPYTFGWCTIAHARAGFNAISAALGGVMLQKCGLLVLPLHCYGLEIKVKQEFGIPIECVCNAPIVMRNMRLMPRLSHMMGAMCNVPIAGIGGIKRIPILNVITR
jgi:hypothetical protein